MLNLQTLKTLMGFKGLSQSDLARKIGVSRQTISSWLVQEKRTKISANDTFKMANALGVKLEDLFHPLPLFEDPKALKKVESELLWDRLYPDLTQFLRAVIRGELPALARLVQLYGLFQSEKIAGAQVWEKYPRYKNQLVPVVQKKMEILWNLKKSQV